MADILEYDIAVAEAGCAKPSAFDILSLASR